MKKVCIFKEIGDIMQQNEIKIINRLSAVSVVGNAVLTVFKMVAGLVGNSSAMVSDAIHSFSDILTTVIAYVGTRISGKRADKEHPYGHERVECVASLLLSLMLLATGLGIGYAGMRAIVTGTYKTFSVPGPVALVAAVVSIVTKEAMFQYTRHYAKILHSDAFLADAWHHRSDALSSIGSLLGIGGAMLGFPVCDSVASVVICVFIAKAAYDIAADALCKLLDTACSDEFEAEIRGFVENEPQVERVDLLHTRQFGNRVYLDLEIAMDGSMKLDEAHAIAESVHSRIEARFPSVKHVMIHVNPDDKGKND